MSRPYGKTCKGCGKHKAYQSFWSRKRRELLANCAHCRRLRTEKRTKNASAATRRPIRGAGPVVSNFTGEQPAYTRGEMARINRSAVTTPNPRRERT